MKPAKLDVAVVKGTKFDKTFTWYDAEQNPRDLTNFTGESKFRGFQNEGEVSAVVTVGGSDGTIRVRIPAATTAGIEWELGEWYLNIQASGDDPERLLYGVVNASD